MSAGPRLIVNVDDLGLHPAVRRAVEACAAQGTVTSASVLANGPDQDAVRPYPGLTLGAHLNILRGAPLSPPREVTSLVGENGLFLGSFPQLALRALRGQLQLEQVRLEWSRQVAFLGERGLTLSHIDSEQHTHCLPGLFSIACEVAHDHRIGWVRRSDERFGNAHFTTAALRRALLRVLCTRAHASLNIRTTDAVWGITEQGSAFTAQSCTQALKGIGPRTIEVICHPGDQRDGDPALPASFGRMRVHQWWEPELRSLLDGSWTAAAVANGWRLAGFDKS